MSLNYAMYDALHHTLYILPLEKVIYVQNINQILFMVHDT